MRHHLIALVAVLAVPAVASARIVPIEVEAPRPPPRMSAVESVGDDLASLRDLPADSAQLVVWYDGNPAARPSLQLECRRHPGAAPERFGIAALPRSSQMQPGQVATRQFRMGGCVPTGVAHVHGVVPDGVIDGVAFGLLYRDADGGVHLFRSIARQYGTPSSVGMWPIAFSDRHFAGQTPQLSAAARPHARAILSGAQYLPNGTHAIPFYGLPR